jgi:hypothetical protein
LTCVDSAAALLTPGWRRCGVPVELPAGDTRRDGSGVAMTVPDIIGQLIERG